MMGAIAARSPELGVVEWFRPGEHDRVELALDLIAKIGFRHLRTHLSWADYHTEDGREWYDWLWPRLSAQVEVLPCVHYTPPSISRTGSAAGPPEDPRAYADFLDVILDRWGDHFTALELWNEPNNLSDWDWRADPDWQIFSEMMCAAGNWVRERGRTAVLGGPCPLDLNWLQLMAQRSVLANFDAIALHGFPGTWESREALWQPWSEQFAAVEEVMRSGDSSAEIWITEAGFSTWRHDYAGQIECLQELRHLPVPRVYFYALRDLHPETPTQDGLQFDVRHYHFGLYDSAGREKPAARVLEAGTGERISKVLERKAHPQPVRRKRAVLITGGAGFIGTNLADTLASEGHDILVYDSLRRRGTERNLEWLLDRHPRRVEAEIGDVRDSIALRSAVNSANSVFHLAAQVAVTTGLEEPSEDFEINARGTLNLLEALRRRSEPPPCVFASTNKVYGALEDLALVEGEEAYRPWNPFVAEAGIDERAALDFHTPYGCSKGAADQYVLDYARSYGLPCAVLRMSCVYGPHQHGTEDQGWVAHFALRALADEPIVIYGNGKQVRDVLYVGDAVAAYRALADAMPRMAGRVFNLGGGPDNAVSLLQLIAELERATGQRVRRLFQEWRPGDQHYFVANCGAIASAVGWSPRVGWKRGVGTLIDWFRKEATTAPPSDTVRTLEGLRA